jgi:signal transduction histidine kinase
VSMMGELAASLAHEIKQPIPAITTSAEACLRFLQCEPADMEEAGQAILRIIDAAHRATQIIDRNRGLFGQAAPRLEVLDLTMRFGRRLFCSGMLRATNRSQSAPTLSPLFQK